MAIVANDPKFIKHSIQVIESEKALYADKTFLDGILVRSPGAGIKRNHYYIMNTGVGLRAYTSINKNVDIFEKLIAQCRSRGASLLMIKF